MALRISCLQRQSSDEMVFFFFSGILSEDCLCRRETLSNDKVFVANSFLPIDRTLEMQVTALDYMI